MRSADPRFPVGRTRLETVGVVACAIIMTIATIEVIQSAAEDLIAGFVRGQVSVAWLRLLQQCPRPSRFLVEKFTVCMHAVRSACFNDKHASLCARYAARHVAMHRTTFLGPAMRPLCQEVRVYSRNL